MMFPRSTLATGPIPRKRRGGSVEPGHDPGLRDRRQIRGGTGLCFGKSRFMSVRDPLDWSLPLVWHLNASRGVTPMVSRRVVDFYENVPGDVRFDLESDTHIVTGAASIRSFAALPNLPVGTAYIHRNTAALPRARLVGKPIYVDDRLAAIAAVKGSGNGLRDHLVVEDPGRPLVVDGEVSGKARIVEDLPERVVIETDAATPAYLVLGDTFDPGLVGHGRRPAGADLARVRRLPRRLPSRRNAYRCFQLPPGRFHGGVGALGLWNRARPFLLVAASDVVTAGTRTRGPGLAIALADMVVLIAGCPRARFDPGCQSRRQKPLEQ